MKIGKIDVVSIFELDASNVIGGIISMATPKSIQAIDWLTPNYASKDGSIKAVNQAFLLKTPNANIIIDTGVGNGRSRPELPAWDNLNTPFFENLKNEIDPLDVDFVICTHLHFDHIGWNTYLKDSQWMPLFPNAKYVFVQDEFKYWMSKPKKELIDDLNGIEESIKPIYEAGRVQLVKPDAIIIEGVRMLPTPGHTPHHASVLVESDGHSALFVGDVFHHPCQIANPDWISFDTDEKTAIKTRKKLLERFADTDTRIIGAHFAKPNGRKIVSLGASYLLEA